MTKITKAEFLEAISNKDNIWLDLENGGDFILIEDKIFYDMQIHGDEIGKCISPTIVFRNCTIVNCAFKRIGENIPIDFSGMRFEDCHIDGVLFYHCDCEITDYNSNSGAALIAIQDYIDKKMNGNENI